MRHSDYTIAVDENGQPYISHSDGIFSKARQAGAKYYQKIKTDYGTRYFYDKAEWDAYVKGQGAKPTSLLGKAKDKLGFDERVRRNITAKKANDAYETFKKGTEGYKRAEQTGNFAFGRAGDQYTVKKSDGQRLREAMDAGIAQRAYDQTILGKGENALNAAKSKIDRMKDDIQRMTSRSTYGEYDENDSDFDENHYTEENRIGDSDFFTFKRDDGRSVILEEDMKWVFPKGVDTSSPAFTEAIDKIKNKPGGFHSFDEWLGYTTSVINEAAAKSKKT